MISATIDFSRIGQILDTLFLLFLGTVGGMVGNAILNCGIQEAVTNSQYIKHIVFFVIIYFTNSFVTDKSKSLHPIWTLINTALIYALFMLLMKTEKVPFLIVILSCAVLYVMREYRNYLKKNNEDGNNDKAIDMIEKVSIGILAVVVITVLVGSYLYYSRQKIDKGEKFDHIKYFFGTNSCDFQSRPIKKK